MTLIFPPYLQDSDSAPPRPVPPPAMHPYPTFPPLGLALPPGLSMGTGKPSMGGHPLLMHPGSQVCVKPQTAVWSPCRPELNIISLPQARVSLPGGLAMHSIPGRQVCIDTGLPPFFHMPPPAHAHAPAPSSPQPPPSPHSSHTHKVRAGLHKRGRLVLTLTLSGFMFVSPELYPFF